MRRIFIVGLLLVCACKLKKPMLVEAENKQVSKDLHENSQMDTFIKPWRDSVNRSMNRFVGITDTAYLNRDRNGNLGELVADLGYAYAKKFLLDSLGIMPHCSIFNFGGLRNSLPKDTIRLRDVFEALPFDNEITVLQVRGRLMDSVLNLLATKGGEPVSAIEMRVAAQSWTKANIAGLPFDSRHDYWIVVNDFMLGGGDGYALLKGASMVIHTGKTWRAAVVEGIEGETKTMGKVQRRGQKRIITEKKN